MQESYNEYQKLHYQALYGEIGSKKVKKKKKLYALYEHTNLVLVGNYALLQETRNQLINKGLKPHYLTIKEYKNANHTKYQKL